MAWTPIEKLVNGRRPRNVLAEDNAVEVVDSVLAGFAGVLSQYHRTVRRSISRVELT